MKKAEEKIITLINEKGLLQKDDKVLVALSGGPDSVLLLYVLHKFKKRFKIELGAVHINHKLRGKNADEDELFCVNLCSRLGIEIFTIKKDVKSFSKKNKISFEEAGREIRYKEFQKIAGEKGYTKIATAHIAGDNAETVLLNLIKGTGLKGLAGIPPRRENIIRPLLKVTKEEILSYLKKNNLSFRTDESNLQTIYERNFIREELIPLIKKLNPSFEETVFHNSEIFRKYLSYLEKIITPIMESGLKFTDEALIINNDALQEAGPELTIDLFKIALEKYFSYQANYDELNLLSELKNKIAGSKVNLSQNYKAVRERGEILIFKENEKKIIPVIIKVGEKVKLNGLSLQIQKLNRIPKNLKKDKREEFISADNLSDEFIIRKWNHGDKFCPLGLKGRKKISDFLNEQKVSHHKKETQLVLENEGKIIWVIGLRVDDSVKITSETKKAYHLCLK